MTQTTTREEKQNVTIDELTNEVLRRREFARDVERAALETVHRLFDIGPSADSGFDALDAAQNDHDLASQTLSDFDSTLAVIYSVTHGLTRGENK